ncbi:sensor histidine kinase [Pyxidicoccus xibeiensis]|uniref:sensor histidine kinase n=1 Tax=Pyxidicoccus xibeiensis TaxID=2906759 RepID=UPI0020A7D4B1|nr:PAS domain S-box protein [Pyxidicoccus xibeiensis]MCP3136564.1 PAS domain S-box protein [Pyxidicoccus xibeiensis]
MSGSWRLQSRIATVVRALAWLAALGAPALGVLSLVGWARGVPVLKSLVTGFPVTPPPSCLALILGGLALGLRLPRRHSRLREVLAVSCAAGMMAIGAGSLWLEVTGQVSLLDALFAGMAQAGEGTQSAPALTLSPLTSVCLLLLGPALLLAGARGHVAAKDTLAVLSLLGAMLGFNGLLFGPLVASGTLPFLAQRSMGLPTALSLLLLGMGTLCARPEQGLMARVTRDTLGGFLARRLVPVTLLGPPLLGLSLVLLHLVGAINPEAKFPIFATVVSTGGAALVLLAARALDVLEARREQATAALEASEARFRGLLETTPAPLLTVDSLGLLRFVNAEAERVFGYSREELLGREVEVLVPEGLFGGHRVGSDLSERALDGLRKDGSRVPLEVRLRPVSGEQGPSVLAVLRDVTERELHLASVQRAREEAEMQRSRLQALLDHAPVGVIFLDLEHGAVIANPVAENMVGMSLPFIGKRGYLDRLRHPDGRPVREEELPSTLAARTGKMVGPAEFRIDYHDGRSLPVLTTAAPVLDASGRARGVVITAQDLTTRHELERLREEYVSLISHDLRSPLQTINLRASLLRRGLRERRLSREEELTEAILRSVAWMNSMIEELLEGSRLEAKRDTLRREPKDLVRFLEEVLERDVPPDLRERFRLEVAGPMPHVWVDPARLERVLANLLGNAAKYSPAALPVVVRARAHEAHVVVSVSDQGPGLAPEDAVHIFEKYYRTRQGSASDTKGLGLGLYISRLIIEAHDGRIWVESQPGRGASFCFSLPVGPPRQQPASAPGTPAHEPGPPGRG